MGKVMTRVEELKELEDFLLKIVADGVSLSSNPTPVSPTPPSESTNTCTHNFISVARGNKMVFPFYTRSAYYDIQSPVGKVEIEVHLERCSTCGKVRGKFFHEGKRL